MKPKSSAQNPKVQRKTQKFSAKPKKVQRKNPKVQRKTKKFSAKPKSSAQNPKVQRKTHKFSAKLGTLSVGRGTLLEHFFLDPEHFWNASFSSQNTFAQKVQRKTQKFSAKPKSSAQNQKKFSAKTQKFSARPKVQCKQKFSANLKSSGRTLYICILANVNKQTIRTKRIKHQKASSDQSSAQFIRAEIFSPFRAVWNNFDCRRSLEHFLMAEYFWSCGDGTLLHQKGQRKSQEFGANSAHNQQIQLKSKILRKLKARCKNQKCSCKSIINPARKMDEHDNQQKTAVKVAWR